jgi:sec-independent protein translocase protein TatA
MPIGLLTPAHVGLILIVLLLIFGPKRLPETGRALGRGIREFKDAVTGDRDSSSHAELEPPPKP